MTLTFRVDGLEEILWWVLVWSGRATVLRPPELRELVVEQLRKALSLNEDDADSPRPSNKHVSPSSSPSPRRGEFSLASSRRAPTDARAGENPLGRP